MESGFTPVDDPVHARQLLGRAVDHLVELRFKLTNDPHWVHAKLSPRSDAVRGIWFEPIAADLHKILDLVKANRKAQRPDGSWGQFEAPAQTLLFLKGQVVLGLSSQSLVIESGQVGVLPSYKIFKLQRRKAARLEIPSGYDQKVSVREVSRRLHDLSLSGLSFLVDNLAAAEVFKIGMMVNSVQFRIEAREFKLRGQVCNHVVVADGPNRGKVKVGLKFLALDAADGDFIETYVSKQLFAYSGAGSF